MILLFSQICPTLWPVDSERWDLRASTRWPASAVEWLFLRRLAGEWLCLSRKMHRHGWDPILWLFSDARLRISDLQSPIGGGRVGKEPWDCLANAEAPSRTRQ